MIDVSLADTIAVTDTIGFRLNPDPARPLLLAADDSKRSLVADDLRGELLADDLRRKLTTP